MNKHSIVDSLLEFIDPTPDIYAMFREFDRIYFWGKLESCTLKWSSRMTLCAGVCKYEGRGGLCSIHLSQPLLKLRPRKDLVQTLLHEMIHAYLFVTHNNKDHNAHGPEFVKHMNRINQLTGANITIYHSFHDEVDLYRQHWWQCDGPCRDRQPYYGLLKRSKNRPPGPSDLWWNDHQASCGGSYIKIKSPEPTDAKGVKEETKFSSSSDKKLKTDFKPFGGKGIKLVSSNGDNNPNTSSGSQVLTKLDDKTNIKENFYSSSKKSRQSKLDDFLKVNGTPSWSQSQVQQSSSTSTNKNIQVIDLVERLKVTCPVCKKSYKECEINAHLDTCLSY